MRSKFETLDVDSSYEDLERKAQGGSMQSYNNETVRNCVKNLKGAVGYFEGFLVEKGSESEESAEQLDSQFFGAPVDSQAQGRYTGKEFSDLSKIFFAEKIEPGLFSDTTVELEDLLRSPLDLLPLTNLVEILPLKSNPFFFTANRSDNGR
jgi:hypothetical protein